MQLRDKHWSEGVARQAVKYSGKLPFAEVVEGLQEMGQIDISVKSVWRLTQRWGEAIQALEAKESEQANHTYDPPVANSDGQAATKRRGVAMDGAMIYVRQEG